LLMTLCRFANSDDMCWRTISNLSEVMGISERTIMRSAKKLEDLNIILIARKRDLSGKSHPNIYALNIHKGRFDSDNLTGANKLDSDSVSPTTHLDSDNLTHTNDLDSDTVSGASSLDSDIVSLTVHKPSDTVTLTTHLDSDNLSPACGKVGKNSRKKLVDSDNLSPEIVTICPKVGDTVSPKYKVNINNNINTGGESKLTPSGEDIFLNHPNLESSKKTLSDDLIKRMDLWTFLKNEAKKEFEITLPSTPSELDLKAFDYMEEVYSLDMSKRINWRELSNFACVELGLPEKVFNPAVRLMKATDEHPKHDLRFSDRMNEWDFVFYGDEEENLI
jgi:DNA-binding transcriptional ArsR family regulator